MGDIAIPNYYISINNAKECSRGSPGNRESERHVSPTAPGINPISTSRVSHEAVNLPNNILKFKNGLRVGKSIHYFLVSRMLSTSYQSFSSMGSIQSATAPPNFNQHSSLPLSPDQCGFLGCVWGARISRPPLIFFFYNRGIYEFRN